MKLGDKLPTRIIGPHSIASFATEWRAYMGGRMGNDRAFELRVPRPRVHRRRHNLNANVIDKLVDDQRRHLVQVDFKMTNQTGATLATGKAAVQLLQR